MGIEEIMECYGLLYKAYGWIVSVEARGDTASWNRYYVCNVKTADNDIVRFVESRPRKAPTTPRDALALWLGMASGNGAYTLRDRKPVTIPSFSSAAELRIRMAAEGILS